jgi:hypothetical protein
MTVIRCDISLVQLALELFPCQLVQLSLRYLGMPLSPGKLPKSAWQPLIDRAADRLLVWKGNMMNRSGHLELIKSTLCAIPIYTAIGLGLAIWV